VPVRRQPHNARPAVACRRAVFAPFGVAAGTNVPTPLSSPPSQTRSSAPSNTGDADLVALARELFDNPNWTVHAGRELGTDNGHQMWHPECGWWLEKPARAFRRLGLRS
jgi:2,4-dienoyl-CoA reductase-like NADH-dependent reductase (Old Yellow Enzyme family)